MLAKAVLTVSIDVDADAAQNSVASHRDVAAVTDRLLEMLAHRQIAATWALAEPSASSATERIVTRPAGHEIALLGDATWVGAQCGRGVFGRELTRRLAAAQAMGLVITTLAVRGAEVDSQGDLACKQGITAVRHERNDVARKPRGRMQPGTLRFGLWSFPVSHALPGNNRWLPGGGGSWAGRRLVDRVIVERGLVQ
jgi:hypothetical protein